jgi:L,D-transpeptidase ErfK/SrfK
VAQLFAEVPVGTPVTAVNQTVKVGWHMGELYLEAQPDFAQIDELEETQGISPRPVTDEDRRLILDRAGADALRIDWTVAEAELIKRRGIPVQITRPATAFAQDPQPLATATPPAAPQAPAAVAQGEPAGGLY